MFSIHRSSLSKSALLGIGALAALLTVSAAQAQIASTTNTYDAQVPFSITGVSALTTPAGVAVAPDGTVYVADVETGTTGRVLQITPAKTVSATASRGPAYLAAPAVVLAPSIALSRPTAVAVDSTGALYIADSTGHNVIKMATPETSNAATPIIYPGTETPTALAVDSSNNLYIADETQHAIYEDVGGTVNQLPITVPTPLMPVGLAVDAAGNVYFADNSNEVYKYIPATAATGVFLTTSSAGNFQFSSATTYPIGMGFDPSGALYILDSATGSQHLIEVSSPATSTTNVQLPFSTSSTATGLTVSSTGNLYISDSAAPTVAEIYYNNNPFNFGSLLADYNSSSASASPAVTVNFQFNTKATTLAIYQSMQGDPTAEFGTQSTMCSGALGSTCSMSFYVEYSSSYPGTRNAAVGLTDANGDVLAAPNTGIDIAGSLALYPGTQSTLSQAGRTLYEPQGMAITGENGTLFVADEGGVLTSSGYTFPNGAVLAYKMSNGVPSGTPTTVGSFPTPVAVALDPWGNLYVADWSGTVSVVPIVYSTTGVPSWPSLKGTPLTLTGSVALNHPVALAFDASGNLYIGDLGPGGISANAGNPGYIIKVPAGGGPAVRLNYSVNGTPVIFPDALATDSFGNLYIADAGDGYSIAGSVDVVPVSTGTPFAVDFGSYAPLNEPGSVALDAANDLYVVDSYNQRILLVPMTYSGNVPSADTGDIALFQPGVSGLTASLITPASLVVWNGGQSIAVSDIGYQTNSGTSYPTAIYTLQATNTIASPTTTTPTVLVGLNAGNQQITFAAPGNTNPGSYTLSSCGPTGTTISPGIANACNPTISYNGGAQGATITLNGNAADTYSTLGNTITVAGAPYAVLTQNGIGIVAGTTQTDTLTNTGGSALDISSISVTAGNGDVTGGTCNTSTPLLTNQSCTINLLFTKTGTGLITGSATVSVASNASNGTQSITTYFGYLNLARPAGGNGGLGFSGLDIPASTNSKAKGGR